MYPEQIQKLHLLIEELYTLKEAKRKDSYMAKNLQSKFSPRQYMLSRDFEIYYYNEPGSVKVRLHTHDYYEFYFFLEGDVSILIEKKEYPLKYGDMVLIPPGVPHQALIHDTNMPYRRFVFWISVDYCSQLLKLSPTVM